MIYFNICAAVILCILAFSSLYRKMSSSVSDRLFVVLLTITLAATVCDIISISMDNSAVLAPEAVTVSSNTVRLAAHCGYLALRNVIPLIYIIYLFSLTDTQHKLQNRPLLGVLLFAPYGSVVVLLIANLFTGNLFYFAENEAYTRGTLFPLLYGIAVIYIIIGFSYVFRYRKLFSFDKVTALYAIFPLNLGAAVFQWFFKGIQIELFVSAVALLLITIAVQRPEQIIDSITGLRNSSAFVAETKRNFKNDKHTKIIFINIANYSSVMGIIGFDYAKNVLSVIAARLNNLNKEMKTRADIYHLDRGQFRYVLYGKDAEAARETAERINEGFKRSLTFNHMELNLITYVCLASCPEDIGDHKTLMDFGNVFHERIPFSGNVIIAEELAAKNSFALTRDLDAIIDEAIAHRRFQVYYQPIYSVIEKRFVTAEALLRLYDERYGFISPDIFITAAEKSGAIHRIGDYVLEEVCRFISSGEFDKLGLEYIEINLSVAQCMQADLADKVMEIIGRYGVSPEKINFEITETAASYSQNIMTSNIEKLINAGLTFALDDYGTGYSNIKSVASLPLTIVKLDKTFAAEVSGRMESVLINTIKMIKDMQMHIVVEGVETEQLADKFASLGCEYIQGYYYSRPIPEVEFIEFMSARSSV